MLLLLPLLIDSAELHGSTGVIDPAEQPNHGDVQILPVNFYTITFTMKYVKVGFFLLFNPTIYDIKMSTQPHIPAASKVTARPRDLRDVYYIKQYHRQLQKEKTIA
jgi:hypothetical protein